VLEECIGDLARIEKAVTSRLAAITLPESRFYVQLNNFRFARNPPSIDVLENDVTVPNDGGLSHHEL
jgi:hypothetical protein